MPIVLLPILLTVFTGWIFSYTRTHHSLPDNILYYVAYIWLGLIFIFFSIVIVFALLRIIFTLFHAHAAGAILKPLSLVAMFAAAVLAIWGGFAEPKIKHIYVHIPNMPDMTAAIISDTHLGTGVSLARWQKALKRIQSQQPDAIFVLGDLFEYGKNQQAYANALANIKTPLGTYGVFGNHEYYVGYQNSVNFYEQAGIKLLQNQLVTLPNGVQIIGVKDIKTASVTEEQLDKLLAQTSAIQPRILLSHQPLLTETVAKHQVPLMLSGHTHAGQIWPFNYLVKLTYRYVYGLYRVSNQTQLYVTSGLFYWGIPLRLFAPAEIPIIHFQNHA